MAVKKETKTAKTVAKPSVKAEKVTKPVVKAAASKTVKATTQKPVASKSKAASEVEFKVFAPTSNSVAIAGDFNAWKPVPFKKGKEGNWNVKIKLSSGTYQYKLIFDNQYWETDSSNPERVPDGQGGENSIKRV